MKRPKLLQVFSAVAIGLYLLFVVVYSVLTAPFVILWIVFLVVTGLDAPG